MVLFDARREVVGDRGGRRRRTARGLLGLGLGRTLTRGRGLARGRGLTLGRALARDRGLALTLAVRRGLGAGRLARARALLGDAGVEVVVARLARRRRGRRLG